MIEISNQKLFYRKPVHLIFVTKEETYQMVSIILDELLPPFLLTNTVATLDEHGQLLEYKELPRFVSEFIDLDNFLAIAKEISTLLYDSTTSSQDQQAEQMFQVSIYYFFHFVVCK